MAEPRMSIRALRLSYELKDPPTRVQALEEIRGAVKATDGNVVRAAEMLGVSHRVLLRWAKWFPDELGGAIARARSGARTTPRGTRR